MFLPECVAKGSRFTFGSLGVDTCSRDPASGVRNRPQPSAHDRREGKVAVPMGKATKTCLSRRVRRCAHVVLRGRRGTLWHSTCVSGGMSVRDRPWTKVAVPMGKAWKSHKNVSFSTCQKMCSCRFAWQAWHFVTFDACFRWNVCARPSVD